jgi:predicted MFS family arabinose efflux permease
MTGAEEWRAHWPLVLAAFLGLSLFSIAIYSTGIVIEPISKEFGWTRTQITAGYTTSILLAVPLSPFVGGLIDRWGVRRLALPGILMTGVALSAIGLADGSFTQWLGIWTFHAIAHLMIISTVWTAAITGTFTAARSMAISVALCGTAFSAVLVPTMMQYLTDNLGWREAYMIIAVAWSVPTFILSYFFLSDARDRQRAASRRQGKTTVAVQEEVALEGLTVREALRNTALWRIAIATMGMLIISSGLLVHTVPLLSEVGVSRTNAALLASLAGSAAVVGKIATGWLMQRYDAGWVAAFTNGITAVALVFLLEPFQTPLTIVLSMLFVGYAGGTKFQICVYLTGIYAGMRNYGKIYGVMASIIAAAGGLGPMVAGVTYDLYGGYGMFIIGCIPASVVCGALLIGLGPYPSWSKALEITRKAKLAPSASH